MSVSVSTENLGDGRARAKARIHRGESSRAVMRRVLAEHDFEHAIGSAAQAVAVELVSGNAKDVDERLAQMAAGAENAMLDALVTFAAAHGWRPST